MSAQWKFEVRVKTPSELDTEEADVRDLAELMHQVGRTLGKRYDMEVQVSEVERT